MRNMVSSILVIIVSGNDLSQINQAILSYCWYVVIGALRKKLQWNSNQTIKIFIQLHLEMLSGKCRPFYLGLLCRHRRWSPDHPKCSQWLHSCQRDYLSFSSMSTRFFLFMQVNVFHGDIYKYCGDSTIINNYTHVEKYTFMMKIAPAFFVCYTSGDNLLHSK